MSIPASAAAFVIPDNTPDCPAAFPFLLLLIDSDHIFVY